MKAHMVIGLVMIFTGIFLVVVSLLSMIGSAPLLSWIIPLAVGVFLCVVGFVLLITELLEAWLSRGQKALVDGLQAG